MEILPVGLEFESYNLRIVALSSFLVGTRDLRKLSLELPSSTLTLLLFLLIIGLVYCCKVLTYKYWHQIGKNFSGEPWDGLNSSGALVYQSTRTLER